MPLSTMKIQRHHRTNMSKIIALNSDTLMLISRFYAFGQICNLIVFKIVSIGVTFCMYAKITR